MFGFLKELAAAAREGIDEAKQEFADEQAAAAERTRAEREAYAASLAAEVAATPPEDTWAVALGAVYRETFLGELAAAAEQQRPPAYLYICRLPPDEVESVGKLLRRDFDAVSARAAVDAATTLEQGLDLDIEADALLIARGCWLVTAAAGIELVGGERVAELTQPFVIQAERTYSSWTDFGAQFLAGERRAPGSNPLGRRALAKTVDNLLSTPGSPWHDRPWLRTG